MKRILSSFVILFLAVFLLASCGDSEQDNVTDNNDNQSEEQENTDTNDAEGDTADMNDEASDNEQAERKQQMEELDMKDFELEVKYEGNKEYEAEIDFDNEHYTAELEDELAGVQKKGQEAFDEIYPMLKGLTITKDTAKEDVISETLKAFNLNDDYVKFELEITFNDGTEMEYEDK